MRVQVKIGYFADCGVCLTLARERSWDSGVASYLVSTGLPLKGSVLATVGIATHYVPSQRLDQFEVPW